MRISVKGRYALAAIIRIASESASGDTVSVNSIAEKLGISKIYLEQVFAQLKKSGLLSSVKGPRGGYQLAKPLSAVTAWDVLSAIEVGLIEKTEETVWQDSPEIESVIQGKVFEPLDNAVQSTLKAISLRNLLDNLDEQAHTLSFMQGI